MRIESVQAPIERLKFLRNFKTESLSVLAGVGIGIYAALSGSINNDPAFKISYSCEENKMTNNRAEGKHIEIEVVSNYRTRDDSLLIFWTPQRLSRFNPERPFNGSAKESFEMPNGVSVPKGTVARLRIVHSDSPDLKHSLSSGREVAAQAVPITCE